MRKWVILLGLAGLAGAGGYLLLRPHGGEASATQYRTASPDRGPIVAAVRATGTINPISTVIVGSQLSGQVVEILADYNAEVKANQVVARLNADQIRSRYDAAQAELAQARAEQEVRKAQGQRARATREKALASMQELEAQRQRTQAQLADAQRALDRQRELFNRGAGARAAFDSARTQFEVQTATLASVAAQASGVKAELLGIEADIALADAQVASAAATTQQREAKLRDIQIDLDRTDIKSPVDGVIVQRQVELGQTVTASLSTPTLFLIAQDLTEVEIHANIDEADVGRLRTGQAVTFSVNAYPNRTFTGRMKLVRLGATTVQNVVTYTGVVSVSNADRALLPGMTANIQIVTDNRENALRVPNAALRFRPAGSAPVGLPQAEAPAGPAAGAGQGGGGGGGGGGFGQQALAALRERITTEVKPTPEQMKAIEAIIAESREAMRGMRTGMSPEEMRGLGQTMRREMGQKIARQLDPERRAKFEAMSQARAARTQQAGTPARLYLLDAKGEVQAVNARIGITDGSFTEIVSGELSEESRVVIGGGPRASAAAPPAAGGPPRGPRLF